MWRHRQEGIGRAEGMCWRRCGHGPVVVGATSTSCHMHMSSSANTMGCYISRGHSEYANSVGFGTFPGFSDLLVRYAKISSRWGGGGGVCVYFFKICTKRLFGSVISHGGG